MTAPLVSAEAVVKHFPAGGSLFGGAKRVVHALDGVSFHIDAGDTYGLVGESGCGKTTMGRLLLYLDQPTGGKITVAGTVVDKLGYGDELAYRRSVQAVFQDPYGSLSPRSKVLDCIGEPLTVQQKLRGPALRDRVRELIATVGLPRGAEDMYPHEFSGGQRQRIAIARAISVQPKFIVLDEPVSALDVSIRAQILNLLKDLQERLGLTYLFIAHDLAVVEFMSSRIGVMYLGKMVEEAEGRALYRRTLHPYTKALMRAATATTRPAGSLTDISVTGEVPSPINPPSGCRFHTRCPWAQARCSAEEPLLRPAGDRHTVACHFAEAIEAGELPKRS